MVQDSVLERTVVTMAVSFKTIHDLFRVLFDDFDTQSENEYVGYGETVRSMFIELNKKGYRPSDKAILEYRAAFEALQIGEKAADVISGKVDAKNVSIQDVCAWMKKEFGVEGIDELTRAQARQLFERFELNENGN